MLIFLKLIIYRFSVIPTKHSRCLFFFSLLGKLLLKCIWKYKEPKIAKTVFGEKNEENLQYLISRSKKVTK